MLDDDIVEAAKRLLDICKRKNLTDRDGGILHRAVSSPAR